MAHDDLTQLMGNKFNLKNALLIRKHLLYLALERIIEREQYHIKQRKSFVGGICSDIFYAFKIYMASFVNCQSKIGTEC